MEVDFFSLILKIRFVRNQCALLVFWKNSHQDLSSLPSFSNLFRSTFIFINSFLQLSIVFFSFSVRLLELDIHLLKWFLVYKAIIFSLSKHSLCFKFHCVVFFLLSTLCVAAVWFFHWNSTVFGLYFSISKYLGFKCYFLKNNSSIPWFKEVPCTVSAFKNLRVLFGVYFMTSFALLFPSIWALQELVFGSPSVYL